MLLQWLLILYCGAIYWSREWHIYTGDLPLAKGGSLHLLSCSSLHSSPSSSTDVHHHSRAHRSKLRWPKSSGACTIVLALPLRSWINNSYHSIQCRSSDLKIPYEFLRSWRHGLPHHPLWPGLCLGGSWPGQEPHLLV
jgi:hypothetical protein